MNFLKRLIALILWYLQNRPDPHDPAPDSPANPDAPVTPTPDPQPNPPAQLEHIWQGDNRYYKLVGGIEVPEGYLLTASNVYRKGHRSVIYLLTEKDGRISAREIYTGSQETIGQPVGALDRVYFPVEHGSHCLIYKDGRVGNAGRTRGRWSVCGLRSGGTTALMAYNNQYTGARLFKDKTILARADNGDIVHTLGATAMARSFTELDGRRWYAHNFGQVGVSDFDGRMISCDANHIHAFAGNLYVGCGGAWGRDARPETANGDILRLSPPDFQPRTIFRIDSAGIEHMHVADGHLIISGIDPDQLWAMDEDENFRLIAQVKGETAKDGARGYGAHSGTWNGRTIWARSDKVRPHAYFVDWR